MAANLAALVPWPSGEPLNVTNLTIVTTAIQAVQGQGITWGTAAPTTGAHSLGEIVLNSAPTAGGVGGWVCTTAGTPGTWTAFSYSVIVRAANLIYAGPGSGADALPTFRALVAADLGTTMNPTFASVKVGAITITVGAAAPTTGAHSLGDVCFNSGPAVGQPAAWTCTVAGTPGTWVAWANL